MRLAPAIALVALAAAFLSGAARAGGAAEEDLAGPSAREILQTAFDRMFNYPSVRSVTLRIHRGDTRVTVRSFDVVYKRVEGRGRTLLRFTEPEYLRGNALLIIEETDGRNDIWIYQTEQRRPRRVIASHKAEPFYGSDLSFEDMEHHDWRRFEATRLPDTTEQGRRAFTVEARPRSESQYSKLRAVVEQDRMALLRLDLFKAGSEQPIKHLEIAPDEVVEKDGILEPRRMWVRQEGRDAATEVVFERIQSDPRIADEVFASMRLGQSGLDLFKLVERLRKEEEP
jgi:Outer membrane lipoprotein-sorting protein